MLGRTERVQILCMLVEGSSMRVDLSRGRSAPSIFAFQPPSTSRLVAVMIAGLGFTLMRAASGSTLAPCVAHLVYNGLLATSALVARIRFIERTGNCPSMPLTSTRADIQRTPRRHRPPTKREANPVA